MFIRVNITFFSKHFLGLQGITKRIIDFFAGFIGWNRINSVWCLVSVATTLLFIYTLYKILCVICIYFIQLQIIIFYFKLLE